MMVVGGFSSSAAALTCQKQDSFSTFVSYLLGDEVPTAGGREAQAAKELGEMTTGRAVEEEAQEAPEGLRGRDSEGDGELRGSGEAGRYQEGGSAAEQTWGWREGSSHGSQADRQVAGAWEAAKTTRCQEPGAPSEARKMSEAESGAGWDRSSEAQERQEPDEQEMNKGETLRTWELEEEKEEEEEEVKAKEPGVAGGAESEWTWHGEPEGKAGVGWQKAAGGGSETQQMVKEAVAEETPQPRARRSGMEEEMVVVVRGAQIRGAQGMQGPEAECEDRSTSGREETDLPGVKETESGAVSGERTPEGTDSIWVLEEASKEAWEELVDEKREAESLFSKHTEALGTEGAEEEAEDLTAGSEAAGGRGSEEEVGEGFEGQAAQGGIEAEGRPDSEIGADEASLEEVVQAEEAQELKGSCWAAEAEVPRDKEAKGAEGEADLEATLEARPEEESAGERSEEEIQSSQETLRMGWGGLEHEVTEGPEPELMEGVQTPTKKKPEGGQGGEEELWRVPVLGKEEAEGSLEECPRYLGSVKPDVSEAEAWGNGETGDTQEERPDAEEGEEATGDQVLEAEAQGSRDSGISEVPEAGGEWKRAKDPGCGTEEGEVLDVENQEPSGGCVAEAGAGQAPEENATRESKGAGVEAAVPWGTDRTSRRSWSLEEVAPSLQDSEDTQTRSSSAAEIVGDKDVREDRAEEGPEREAGEAWDAEGREEAGGGVELAEVQPEEVAEGESRGGQEFGLDSSAEGEATGLGGQAEALEVWERGPEAGQAEAGESAAAEGSCGTDHFTSGFQVARAEGAVAMVEAEGLPGEQVLDETEAGVWQVMKQGGDSEGQPGDQLPEGEGGGLFDMEDVEEPEGQGPVAKEVDPEGLGDVEGLKQQSTDQDPPEAEPGPCQEAEAAEEVGSAGREARGSWSEAALPGSRLDVSVPRSRVLLSRSSSQRRSRPSFRRTPTSEQQQAPPSPPPEEELAAPEQSPLKSEEAPEPSPPRPEGSPMPARRRPLGHGFGLAHSGMMQELQARLGQPKPQ
ncbi:apolipoprotein B receptor isoform X2 [Choloepus didactylus]|uniref:apolipoprotein B receptor isoform X2 n=1 Tax=Choloepus didactylus TaxID=27675 RepID=UPI0018A04EA0|nr:apolipoprotein B receptor isoform X2 [Choloepus didactylus]